MADYTQMRVDLFVGILFGPFRAQISSTLLVNVGHCLCLFVLDVALLREVVKETFFYRICYDLWHWVPGSLWERIREPQRLVFGCLL
jgi:hypothetical protein